MLRKYTVVIVDDEKKFWVDDYADLSPEAKTKRFNYPSIDFLLNDFQNLISYYEGYWYFVIDEDNKTHCSGALDPSDTDVWKEI